MAQDTRQDETKRDETRRAPYQPPAIAWEEEFAPASDCSLADGSGCFAPPGFPGDKE
jgi:hypothetical protein